MGKILAGFVGWLLATVVSIGLSLGALALAVWVVVQVLQATGVLS